jgi:hypothetical protein
MSKYMTVKVEFETEDDKGKVKVQKVSYLVDATSCTEAEAKMTKYLVDKGERDFEIKATISSPILDVL